MPYLAAADVDPGSLGREPLPGIPELRLPDAWTEPLARWAFTDPASIAAAALDGQHTPELLVGVGAFGRFREQFWAPLRAALDGRGAAVLKHDPVLSAKTVSLLLVQLLGGITAEPAPGMRQPVIFTPADPNGALWHTDAFPWRAPVRWSVLGLVQEDPARSRAATHIAEFERIIADWDGDPEYLDILRRTPFDWRGVYGGRLGTLPAPALDERCYRWSTLIMEKELRAGDDSPVGRACKAFQRVLDEGVHDEVVVGSGTLVAWDNHRMVHRAPALPVESTRVSIAASTAGSPN